MMSIYPRRSPLQAIRVFCVQCQGGSAQGVTECTDNICPFYAYRFGIPPQDKKHQPMKAIKQFCLINCQVEAGRQEVVHCQGDKAMLGPCPVFPFRLGRNPNVSQATREKRRQAASKRAVKGVFGFTKQTHQHPLESPQSPNTPHPEP